jgi:hypothetical protein
MSKKLEEKIIMRHILEVRLKTRMFSFLDFRGRMVDFLKDTFEGHEIRLASNGTRADIYTKDRSEVYFFSWENFGFQIEAATSFDSFRKKINSFFDALDQFDEYDVNSVVRVGTKSIVLYHKRGLSLETLKNIYNEKFFSGHTLLEKSTGSRLNDSTYVFELNKSGGVINLLSGPVTKDEAILKFFDGDRRHYAESFDASTAVLLAVDFGKKDEKIVTMLSLRNECLEGVSAIEETVEGFKSYFLSSDE